MNRTEFAKIMAFIGNAISKPPNAEQVEVYFDLLGDLPEDVMRMAARRVCLEHPWPSWPSVAELRRAAAQAQRGDAAELTAADAWSLAWKAGRKIDLDEADATDPGGSVDRACKNLPPLVFRAMCTFGLRELAYSQDSMTVVRAQFMKVYEQLAAREKELGLLPPLLRQQIEAKAPQPIAGKVPNIAAIGQMPKEANE